MLNKGVVLLCCSFGEWLKPVGAVGCTHFHCPTFHALRNSIGHVEVERSALLNGFTVAFERFLREIVKHLLSIEDVLSVVF